MPVRPTQPDPILIIIFSLLFSLALGLGLSLLLEYSRSCFRSINDITRVMVVPVLSGVGDPFGEPRVLFADDYLFAGYQYRSSYDITPDGQSFVFVKQVGARASPSIHVWSDVFGELERVAPSR